MSDVFISYQHDDRTFVDRLSDDLRKAGFSSWYDKHAAPASRWRREIVDNVWGCHVLLVVLSQAALQSEWVRFECGLGFALGKTMLILVTDVEQVRMEELPDFLKEIEVLKLSNPSSSDEVISALAGITLPPRLWSFFADGGFDICLPKEQFSKAGDRALTHVEGINLRAINAALGLQQQLLQRFGVLSRESDPIGIRFLPDGAAALPPDRNYLILGGPGGAPFVHKLLQKWSGLGEHDALESGYRFVTDPRRYFIPGPFLRPADRKGMFGGQIDRLGIEDVQGRRVAHFFDYKDAAAATSGRNYVVVYTGGLESTAVDGSKVVILAAFNRQVLDGAIGFLLNRKENNRWLTQVQRCGPYTETLIEFDVSVGQSPVLETVHVPRAIGR